MAEFTRRQFLSSLLASLAVYSAPRILASKRSSVIVVGAGLAGLVAAHRLRQASLEVTLFEASGVPGGRVRTVRNAFDDGLYCEAGATRISDLHYRTLKYAKEMRLSLTRFRPVGPVSILVDRERRFDSLERSGEVNPPLEVKLDEAQLDASGLLQHYVKDVVSDLADLRPDSRTYERWKPYDQWAWPDWLKNRGASADAIRLITLGGDSRDLSALYVLRQIALHRHAGEYYKIDGGMDRLPHRIAACLNGCIRYNSHVVQIEQNQRAVRVTCLIEGKAHQASADYVVLAVPLPLLKRLEIRPLLSEVKRDAAANVPYYSASRFNLQTQTRFWRKTGESGFARTDQPAEITDASFGQDGTRGLLSVTAAAADEDGVSSVSRAFSEFHKYFEKEASTRWKEEPWARGAFATFRPGQMTKLMPSLARPEGRLHFAGEHTSPWMGWMEGAIESGERVAHEILKQEIRS